MIIQLNFTCIITFIIQEDYASKLIKDTKLLQCSNIVLEGKVSDCNVDFQSVNNAVKTFFQPLLQPLTSATFFRYFRVDLESSCPFWQEDGQCLMEGCSVDICDENEIPKIWMTLDNKNNVNNNDDNKDNVNDNDAFSKANEDKNTPKNQIHEMMNKIRSVFSPFLNKEKGINRQKQLETLSLLSRYDHDDEENVDYMRYLRETEDDNDEDDDDDDWTDMTEAKIENCKDKYFNDNDNKEEKGNKNKTTGYNSVYVNLLDNPETYTGYSGPSAHRVWQSIQKENCFGGIDDLCFEKEFFID